MRQIPGFGIEDRLLEQSGGEDRLFDGRIDIADVDARSVVGDLAAGRDHFDRIRAVVQNRQFIEERLILGGHGDGQRIVAQHAHTGDHVARAALVVRHANDGVGRDGLAANFGDLGRGREQDGKRIVIRGDRRSIGIGQVLGERQRIGAVAEVVVRDRHAGHDAAVQAVGTARALPLHQVVAVQEHPNVDV